MTTLGAWRKAGLMSALALPLVLAALPSQAQCPYTSVQSRVQLNEQDPWKQTMTVNQGQSFRVGAFKNGWGQFVDCCTTIAVTAPNGAVSYPTNGSYVAASLTGTYTVRATCANLSDTATVTASVTYDMLDYMFNDNQKKANVLITSHNEVQVIRSYTVTSDRFYITKNYDPSSGKATDYEEYTYDANWIYLVRDTSWQPSNWCSGLPTSFELWTGERNRGARFPRYVTNGMVTTANASIIRARLEGNGCTICDSPTDSDGQYVTSTYRFDKLARKTFTQTGTTLYNLIKITVQPGSPGAGEVYYYSKALGFVGYEDPAQWSYYAGPANGGNDFEVLAQDACPGQTGCVWLPAQGSLWHQIGRPDGYDWSARVPLDNAGYLSYGPYQTQWGVGPHRTHFLLWIDNNANSDIVATIDVVTAYGGRVLARRTLRRNEFVAAQQWQWFTLYFDYPSFEKLETRVYWTDRAYIKHGQQYICK